MSNTKIAIGTVAALSLGTVIVTGPAPASAGAGLTQTISSAVVLDVPVTVNGLEFCHNDICLPSQSIGETLAKELSVDLTYELKKGSALPDIISRAGELSFPATHRFHSRCHGKQGVYLLSTPAAFGTTSVTGGLKGKDTGDKPVDEKVPGPGSTSDPVQETVFCAPTVAVNIG